MSDLDNFIKQQLAQGISRDFIKATLISKGGWNSMDVENAFNLLGTQAGVPIKASIEPVKKTKSHYIFPIIFISLTALLIVFLFLSPPGGSDSNSAAELSLNHAFGISTSGLLSILVFIILPLALISFFVKNRKAYIFLVSIMITIFMITFLFLGVFDSSFFSRRGVSQYNNNCLINPNLPGC